MLDLIHSWQERIYREYGTHFIHAGDEWYLLAEREIPEEETYDGYLQLENGVGMVRLLREETAAELAERQGDDRKRRVTIATGELAAPILLSLIHICGRITGGWAGLWAFPAKIWSARIRPILQTYGW